jgi:hypothetical protein
MFVKELRDVFGVTDDRLRVSVRIYEDFKSWGMSQFWVKDYRNLKSSGSQYVPVVQWIELRSPNAQMEVRFLSGILVF